jgi:hypothetical protein
VTEPPNPGKPAMSDAPRLTPARQAQHAARDKRLAAALRDNLRRRKDQARAKESGTAPGLAAADPAAGRQKPQG